MTVLILTMFVSCAILMTMVFILAPDELLSSANNSERRASKEGRQ